MPQSYLLLLLLVLELAARPKLLVMKSLLCSLQIQSLTTQELFVPEGDSLVFESNHMPDTLMTPHEVLLHNTTKELI
jgi:hypothetical protein